MAADFLYGLLPEHLLLGVMISLMLLEMFRVDARWARRAFVVATLAGLAAVIQQLATGYGADVVAGEIVVDRLALVGKLVILACALALAVAFAARESFKHWLLVASSTLGALVILDSAGFASLFIGIEMLSLPAFALMVHGRGNTVASEGAFKYLVLSSVASALLLFGVSLGYGSTGTLSIAAWTQLLAQPGALAKAASLLVLCGLFLKTAVFPLHAWAPDAYASARMPVTALLASVVKAAVVLALLRVVSTAPLDAASCTVVAVLAIASIAFGNLAALGQQRLRRLLAYSSVAHAGYMIFALLDTTGNRVDDLLLYTAIYALGTLLACASYAALNPGDDDDLQPLDGKFASQPVAALLLSLAVLSLAGVPPFPGFFAKLFVFRSVVASGYLVPAVIAFVGSFKGLAYYVGNVLRLFRTDTKTKNEEAPPTDAKVAIGRVTA
jgi:NADH-quinone oxidoreductase subunit N